MSIGPHALTKLSIFETFMRIPKPHLMDTGENGDPNNRGFGPYSLTIVKNFSIYI